MKIALLVPSRERLNLKLTLISSIITTVSDINNVSLYFGIDDDDPTKDIVKKISSAIPFVHIVPIHNEGKFIGINRIWNQLAAVAQVDHDIFGYIGDDMVFRTPAWDSEILNEFTDKNCPPDQIKMVHCNDGYHGPRLCVNAFIHKKYYEILGYLCRPEFPINYSDSWMWETFSAFKRITYIPHILIEHNHWTIKKTAPDKTAQRMIGDNRERISDKLWEDLGPERDKDVLKLAAYIKQVPDWSVVSNKFRS